LSQKNSHLSELSYMLRNMRCELWYQKCSRLAQWASLVRVVAMEKVWVLLLWRNVDSWI